MGLEEYELFLMELSQQNIEIGESIFHNLEKLLQNGDEKAKKAVELRDSFLGDNEKNNTSSYLNFGFFNNYGEHKRITCFCIGLEAEFLKDISSLRKKCQLYSEEQPLFQTIPSLIQHIRNQELIDFSVFQQIGNSEIVSFNNQFAYIDGSVPLTLLSWMSKNHPQNPVYIRINPHCVFPTLPPQKIVEAQLIPPNPKWWQNLTIYKRNHEGSSFVLCDNSDPRNNRDEYYDYYCKKIRRLEVVATRNGNGNLSMMLEELSEHNNVIFPTEKYVIGRMIHLDTDAPFNSPFKNAVLNHLDLAINIYTEKDANNRLDDNLANGNKTTDASFRTHLMRVENINFTDLFAFAYGFFQSKVLVDEWKVTQFY